MANFAFVDIFLYAEAFHLSVHGQDGLVLEAYVLILNQCRFINEVVANEVRKALLADIIHDCIQELLSCERKQRFELPF